MFAPLTAAAEPAPLEVAFVPPDLTPMQALRLRTSLMGAVTIRWSGAEQTIVVPIPWPSDGIFLLRSDRTWDVERSMWHPRLVLQPGVYFLSRFARDGLRAVAVADQQHEVAYKVRSRRASSKRAALSDPGQHAPASQRHGSDPTYLPPSARHSLAQMEILPSPPPALVDWRNVAKHLRTWCNTNLVAVAEASDAQDLKHQRLFTYGVFVQEAVLRGFARLLWQVDRAHTGGPWEALVERSSPQHWIQTQRLVEQGRLLRIDPLNAFDALSTLTSFQRFDKHSTRLERMAAWRRQNHPSFDGLVCPIETPESKKVGITLHLARGCRVTAQGELRQDESDESTERRLGYTASTVPFLQHNDGVRCMMGAKNLRQAVRVLGAEPPAVLTGVEQRVAALLQPLRDNGTLSSEQSTVFPGVDLLVAYLPWYGWNADDAIVANDRLREVLSWEYTQEFQEFLMPGVRPCDPRPATPLAGLQRLLFEGGLRKPGMIGPGDVVAWLREDATGDVHQVPCGADAQATLEELRLQEASRPGFAGHLSWRLRYRLPLDAGDKLMGRHGNKGVVSTLLAGDQLPRLPNHAAFPESLRGRPVDLVLNPMGVVSRMNLGQLIESHVGLLVRLRPDLDISSLGAPFAFHAEKQRWLVDRFREIEEQTHGLVDRHGRVELALPPEADGGDPIRVKAVAGFQYIVRLKHVPALKAQARRGGTGYPYDLMTGQPVAGRRNRGGQRLGEMEVWALQAHQADANLREVVGPRSDPTCAAESTQPRSSPTFHAIRDHLRAVGIALRRDGQGLKLEWLNPKEIQESGKEVSTAVTWQVAFGGDYQCPRCEYGVRGLVATRAAKRSSQPQPSVTDVIRDHLFERSAGVAVSEATEDSDGLLSVSFHSPTKRRGLVAFDVSRKKRSLTARFSLNGASYAAYAQAQDVGDLKTPAHLMDMRLSCPTHATSFLKLKEGVPVLWPAPGGPCDPALVGASDLSEASTVQPGFIRLPFAVPSPFDHASPPDAAPPPAVECLPVLPLRHRHSFPAANLARAQPLVDPLTGDYADLVSECAAYRQHLEANGDAAATADHSKLGEASARRIHDLLGKVYRHIVGDLPKHAQSRGGGRRTGEAPEGGRLFGKLGLLRFDGLGRRVDTSGRLVIVPDPTLQPDECALPPLLLLELCLQDLLDDPEERPHVERAVADLADELLGATRGETDKRDGRRTFPDFASPSAWRAALAEQSFLLPQLVEAIRPALERHLSRHPDFRVLLNRQPTLHRYNLLAFRATPQGRGGDSPVLRISPLACKPFGADFDGDEMAIHAPLGDAARSELLDLSFGSPRNRLSLADSSPLMGFEQELALGQYLLTGAENEAGARDLEMLILVPGCAACAEIGDQWHSEGRRGARDLLQHLLTAHGAEASSRIHRWAQLAWSAATRSGAGFGWLELLGMRISRALPNPPSDDPNKELEAFAMAALREALDRSSGAPGFGMAALVISGARGKPEQVRQLLGPRGKLQTGGAMGDDPVIASSLATGMTWSDFFQASLNARHSMTDKKLLVAHAGNLTRRLVLGCWRWRIGRADCGADAPRSPLTCKDHHTSFSVCATCYGETTAFASIMPPGFPVGLVAAQSIGERGTQLSMQSGQTGKRAMTPGDVLAILEPRGRRRTHSFFDAPDGFPRLLEWIKDNVSDYSKLDQRHFAMVWLAIHNSPEKTLTSAWRNSAGVLARLAGASQLEELLAAIDISDDLGHPAARVMTGFV